LSVYNASSHGRWAVSDLPSLDGLPAVLSAACSFPRLWFFLFFFFFFSLSSIKPVFLE
jgi:hypothetical protein